MRALDELGLPADVRLSELAGILARDIHRLRKTELATGAFPGQISHQNLQIWGLIALNCVAKPRSVWTRRLTAKESPF